MLHAGSIQCHRALCCSRRYLSRSTTGQRRRILMNLWREFFSDPLQWWDHRSEKENPRFPDFKHKKTQDGLWLNDRMNPPWVKAEMAAILPGTLQVNTFSWNKRLTRYVKSGHYERALESFEQMQQEGMHPDKFTFVPLLNACASLCSLEEGKRIHSRIQESDHKSDVFLGNALIDMYSKCGSIEDAWRAFNEMPIQNTVSWTAIILGYVKCGDGQKALEVWKSMEQAGVPPDPVTFVALLNACASVAALGEGRRVHQQIIQSNSESAVVVGNSLVDMYAKCGSVEEAWRVFNQMPTHDVVSWSSMIAGFGMHGLAKEALFCFESMCRKNVEVNRITLVSLLSACSHGGLVEEGLHFFESMTSVYAVSPAVEHYACMVDLLGRAGRLHQAEDLIKTMPCESSISVRMSLLGACRIYDNLEMGERAAKRVLELDPENMAGYILLSNICVAVGKWDRSTLIKQERLERHPSKDPGHTWIEVANKVNSSTVDDHEHSQIVEMQRSRAHMV